MNIVEIDLQNEMKLRVDEFTLLKSIIHISSLKPDEKNVLIKYTIPAIYALWEGFVVEAFSIYIRELNKKSLTRHTICVNLLSHAIAINFELDNAYHQYNLALNRRNFSNQISYTQGLCTYLDKEIILSTKLPTNSNINYSVLSNLLERFNLATIPENPYKGQLDTLLNYRNKIAHGQIYTPVTASLIDDFGILIQNLMGELSTVIADGYKADKFLSMPTSP